MSAVARFIPNPPALVERRKQNLDEFLALNRSILTCLSAPATLPSILSYCQFYFKMKNEKQIEYHTEVYQVCKNINKVNQTARITSAKIPCKNSNLLANPTCAEIVNI